MSDYCTCLSISRDPLCMHHGDVDKVASVLRAQRDELLAALKECAARLEMLAVDTGSDPEFARIAVAKYRDIVAKAEASHG